MGSPIGIAPSVMINRIVHETAPAQTVHLVEVAKLRADLARAQVQEARVEVSDPSADLVVNGAEVDRLI
jgi:hypothetical protein